ncbi:hypothetical protein CSA37_05810 [Candidatus Fermentibacteria bacterium]|nr:MAG: hypothetical protein CSA37_05810 [Candidatus Fermentibacteria bacterium]
MREVPEAAISWVWLRAGGPGGQHQNKTETAVQLRFRISAADLNESVVGRLCELAGSRLTGSGEIVIEAREHRSREMNKRAALKKLENLLREASFKQAERKPTEPARSSREKRLKLKKRRSEMKQLRKKPDINDE